MKKIRKKEKRKKKKEKRREDLLLRRSRARSQGIADLAKALKLSLLGEDHKVSGGVSAELSLPVKDGGLVLGDAEDAEGGHDGGDLGGGLSSNEFPAGGAELVVEGEEAVGL